MKDFSTIAAPLNELTKKGVEFVWGAAQDAAFDELKHRLISAPLLMLPNFNKQFVELKRRLISAPLLMLPDFNKQFDIECDASGIGIGGVLMQEGKPIAYFLEKLNGAQLKIGRAHV